MRARGGACWRVSASSSSSSPASSGSTCGSASTRRAAVCSGGGFHRSAHRRRRRRQHRRARTAAVHDVAGPGRHARGGVPRQPGDPRHGIRVRRAARGHLPSAGGARAGRARAAPRDHDDGASGCPRPDRDQQRARRVRRPARRARSDRDRRRPAGRCGQRHRLRRFGRLRQSAHLHHRRRRRLGEEEPAHHRRPRVLDDRGLLERRRVRRDLRGAVAAAVEEHPQRLRRAVRRVGAGRERHEDDLRRQRGRVRGIQARQHHGGRGARHLRGDDRDLHRARRTRPTSPRPTRSPRRRARSA